MTDSIDRSLVHGFNKLGLFKLDAAFRNFFDHVPIVGDVFNAVPRMFDDWGISNKAQLEQWNRENPHDQIENPYVTDGEHPAADNDNNYVVVMETVTFSWQKKVSDFADTSSPERDVA